MTTTNMWKNVMNKYIYIYFLQFMDMFLAASRKAGSATLASPLNGLSSVILRNVQGYVRRGRFSRNLLFLFKWCEYELKRTKRSGRGPQNHAKSRSTLFRAFGVKLWGHKLFNFFRPLEKLILTFWRARCSPDN